MMSFFPFSPRDRNRARYNRSLFRYGIQAFGYRCKQEDSSESESIRSPDDLYDSDEHSFPFVASIEKLNAKY